MVYYQSPAPPPTHHQEDLSVPRKWATWDLAGEETGGEQVFFRRNPAGHFCFQFLAGQISFPEIPHLLLKSNKAPASLLLSLITSRG